MVSCLAHFSKRQLGLICQPANQTPGISSSGWVSRFPTSHRLVALASALHPPVLVVVAVVVLAMASLIFNPLRQRAASSYHHLPRFQASALRAYASIHSHINTPQSPLADPSSSLSSTTSSSVVSPEQLRPTDAALPGPKPSRAAPEKKRPQLRATKAALTLVSRLPRLHPQLLLK